MRERVGDGKERWDEAPKRERERERERISAMTYCYSSYLIISRYSWTAVRYTAQHLLSRVMKTDERHAPAIERAV